MRNKRKTFYVNSSITITNALLKAVERRLSQEVIDYCKVRWESTDLSEGYQIDFDYFRDTVIAKNAKVSFCADTTEVRIKVTHRVCYLKEDYRFDREQLDYQVLRLENSIDWDKSCKELQKRAAVYIIGKIESFFGSNAERFILDIKE